MPENILTEPSIDISATAKLARLALTEEEKLLFSKQLQEVLSHVDHLNQLNLKEVAPMTYATKVSDILREDKVEQSFPTEEMMALSPHTAQGLWMVPKVLDS